MHAVRTGRVLLLQMELRGLSVTAVSRAEASEPITVLAVRNTDSE